MRLLSCLVVLSVATLYVAEDLMSCGGFIRSVVPIPYARIQMRLVTSSGLLKYKTECAPSNGYFLMPLYDKGHYILKVDAPDGWSFEPSEVKLHVDGSTDKCSKGEDINFLFTGFTILGQILSSGDSEGPEGVTLTLRNTASAEAKETLSGVQGFFTFVEVQPGSYEISASHSKWKVSDKLITVVVDKDTVTLPDNPMVLGYDVEGRVMVDSEPVAGVYFMLYSITAAMDLKDYCHPMKVEGVESNPDCVEQSNKDGYFKFGALPPGEYSIVPHYQQQEIVFEVVPDRVSVSVQNASVSIQKVFKVQGFSVDGEVLMSEKGKGIAGAKVYLNTEMKATTDSNGKYRLYNMTSGLYLFQVEYSSIKFEPTQLKISPSTPNIPAFIPSRYSVCGRIIISSMPTDVSQVLTRAVQAWDGQEKTIVSTTTAGPDGEFCFLLPVGDYVVKTTITQFESSAGLLLLPEQQIVSVTTSIVNDVLFTQFMTELFGSVTCIASCVEMKVALHRLKDGLAVNEASQRAAVKVKGSTASFQFDKVLPGPYVVAIEFPLWCWEKEVLEVTVDRTNKPTALNFIQVGFRLEIAVPINVTLHYEAKNITSGSLRLDGGVNNICFDKPGEYSLTPSSCYKFDRELYFYSCAAPSPVVLKIVSNLVTATVLTAEKMDDIILTIKIGAGHSVQLVSVGDPDWDETNKQYIYHYEYYAKLKETLEVTPSSSQLLFTPANAVLSVDKDCPQTIAPFHGKHGRIIRGDVSPPLEGVTITLSSEQIGTITVITNKDGIYSYGPILSDLAVTVSAAKENHYFTVKEDDPYSFTTMKMSGVKVKVVDEYKKALSGVLVSLSSASFRSNNFTDASGVLTYTSLTSGVYHLRPLLREYTFQPNTQEFDLSSGESFEVEFVGKRVAFSCYGRVLTLNGHVVEGITVQVVGSGENLCPEFHEEAVTDQKGVYRLRGLSPQCVYSVSVNVENTPEVSRATPDSRQLQVSDGDIGSVDFIVFQRPNTIGITGNILTDPEHLPTLKVVLYRQDESVTAAVSPDTAGFFELSLPTSTLSKSYIVRMESTLSTKAYKYKLPEVSFTADNIPQHLSLTFQPEKKSHELDSQKESFFGIILAVAVIFIGAQYQKFYRFFKGQSSGVAMSTNSGKRTKS